MASTGKCEYCGSTLLSDERTCKSCGAPNPNFVADTERTVFLPRTIEELKEYCAERGMPLLRMRFFIGEDFREAKAFGIFREGDEFVVYKNKADGSRAVRYRGPDEAHAVQEIFTKLLDECHKRDIWPDGRPAAQETARTAPAKQSRKFSSVLGAIFIVFALFVGTAVYTSEKTHANDGYYQYNDRGVYYRYGSDWYYNDANDDFGWYETAAPAETEFESGFIGENYDSDWGVSDFRSSQIWEDMQSDSTTSSDDYDDWDSDDTDWDSDW